MDALQDAPINAPWLFNSETARINALKRHEANRAKAASVQPKACDANEQKCDALNVDPLAADLVRVQAQLVEKMLKANGNPDSIPKLARSFRDVREAYHLVTGQAKPGVIREGNPRNRQRHQAKPQPLPDDGPAP